MNDNPHDPALVEALLLFLDDFAKSTKDTLALLEKMGQVAKRQKLSSETSIAFKEDLGSVVALAARLQNEASRLGVLPFVSNFQPINSFLEAAAELPEALTRIVGSTAPVVDAIQHVAGRLNASRGSVQTLRVFLGPARLAFHSSPESYSSVLRVRTGPADPHNGTVSGLREFAREWETILEAYGALFGRDSAHGQVTGLRTGSWDMDVAASLTFITTVLLVTRSALDVVKSWLDLKSQRIKLQRSAEERGVPLPELDDWVETVEDSEEAAFDQQADEIIERMAKKHGVDPKNKARGGVRAANRFLLKHVKYGGSAKALTTGEPNQELQQLQADVASRFAELSKLQAGVKSLEFSPGTAAEHLDGPAAIAAAQSRNDPE